MNNPTWVDILTRQIPGKTEGVSIITLVLGVAAAIIHGFVGIELSSETLTIINTIVVGALGVTLGSRAKRIETTVNQVQAAQTTSVETAAERKAS